MESRIKQLTVLSSMEKPGIEDSLEWLSSYLEQSWNIPKQYLTLAYSKKVLTPLIKLVPYVPVSKVLYRAIGSDSPATIGKIINLKSAYVVSFTTHTEIEWWKDLAEAIGAYDSEHVFVVKLESSALEIFSTHWISTKVLPYINKNLKEEYPREVRMLNNLMDEYGKRQREVVCYSKAPLRCKVVEIL